MKVDLHTHTHYSKDSLTSPEQVVRWALRRNLDALAITDHNTIAGARLVQAMAPFPVIIGEEIRTSHGEIIGLFLSEWIEPGLGPRETVGRIRAQGGVVYIPHPLDRMRGSRLDFGALLDIIEQVDVLEVLNARVTWAADNQRADQLAGAYHLLRGAGSDAHQSFEIGHAYVEVPPFGDAVSFLKSLARGRVVGLVSSPLVHLSSTAARLVKGLGLLADSQR